MLGANGPHSRIDLYNFLVNLLEHACKAERNTHTHQLRDSTETWTL